MNAIKQELMEFLTHENDYVHEAAGRVFEVAQLLESNEISQDEFDELVGDILDIERAAGAGKSVEQSALIETGIRALISVLPNVVGLVTGK